MKKKLLPDHFIAKELGLEVFEHPEEISNFIYVRTSNGRLHRFSGSILDEDKERSLVRLRELNSMTYDLLFVHSMRLLKMNENLIREYMACGGEVTKEAISELLDYIKEMREMYNRN